MTAENEEAALYFPLRRGSGPLAELLPTGGASPLQGIKRGACFLHLHQAPRWSPAALEHVSDAAVDEYFAPLGERELELPL